MSRAGASIQPMMPSGAPASTAASSTIFAAAMVERFALWCGLIMMPLRVFRASRHLNIAVEVGFVVGIMAQMRPIGSAILVKPYCLSCSITPQVLLSR